MDAEPGRVVIDDTFGAAYIGAMVMMLLYGITTLQTYMYYMRYPKDTLSTKLLVMFLFVLDTLHVILVCHAMYYYLVVNYSFPPGLVDGVWSLYLSLGTNVAIAFVTQCFFTHRLHKLSGGRWWLTGIISLTVVAHLAFGMETMAFFFVKKQLSRLTEITFIAATPFAITAVLSDIIIAAALCILLHSNRSGFRSTNALINYLMIYAINRCLLTSVVAVVEVITFVAMPHSFWFLGIDFVIGKLYANSLLATLNTRSSLRGRAQDAEIESSMSAGLHISVTPSMDRTRNAQEHISLRFAPMNTKSTMSTDHTHVKNDPDPLYSDIRSTSEEPRVRIEETRPSSS